MMEKKRLVAGMVGVAVLACGTFASRSWSQPAEGEAGKAQNPPNKTPKERLAEALEMQRKAAIELAIMKPEQRDKAMRELEAKALRTTLANAGFDDPKLVEVLEKFLAERMQSRRPLRVISTLLYLSTGVEGRRSMNISDAQVASLLKRLEDETQAQKVRETRALDDLDAQIAWKTRPRLKTVLMRNGVIGESAWYARSNLFGSIPTTELEIVRFWEANRKLPPGIVLPTAEEILPAQ